MATLEPFPLESLTTYIRRAARQCFYADTVSFLRAGSVDWTDRSRDPDLLGSAVVGQVAAFPDLAVDRVQALTTAPYIARLPEQDRGSLRWWIATTNRTRVCDRCVVSQPYGRIHWRFPVVTECLVHRRPLLDACRLCSAVRDRGRRRWERFDCGDHVQRSAGAESLSVDLRIQQAIQASLGLARAQSTRAGEWLIHAALSLHPHPVDVQSVRQSLRELWLEHRRVRLAWRGPAQALRILEQRGERMYPTRREPPAAAVSELPPCSPEELRDIASRFRLLLQERASSVSDTPVAIMVSPAPAAPICR